MIAHAGISVNPAYADRVSSDESHSLNLKTSCCASCAELRYISPRAASRQEQPLPDFGDFLALCQPDAVQNRIKFGRCVRGSANNCCV